MKSCHAWIVSVCSCHSYHRAEGGGPLKRRDKRIGCSSMDVDNDALQTRIALDRFNMVQ